MESKRSIQRRLNAGGVVTLAAGVYRISGLKVPKGTTLRGDGDVIFDGSHEIRSTGWSGSGSLRYARYSSIPAMNGAGIDFRNGMNLNDRMGVHADQAWAGGVQLRLVSDRAHVAPGRFALEGRKIWVHAQDAAKGVSVSHDRVWGEVEGTLAKVTIRKYSPNAADAGGVRVKGGTLEDVEISNMSFNSVLVVGVKSVLRRVSITNCGWMGMNINLAQEVTLDHVTITNVNPLGIFKSSPQSGAMKASRSAKITVTNSRMTNVHGHGLWFDQSCTDATVHDTYVRCTGAAVFFEISHGLDLRRCDLDGEQAVKFSGSSGGHIVGNELRGEKDVVGVYVDPRSHPGWSNPRSPRHEGVYTSDRLPVGLWDPRVTWLTRIEELRDNTIHTPAKAGYCGKPAKVCVLTHNRSASILYADIMPHGHQEDGQSAPAPAPAPKLAVVPEPATHTGVKLEHLHYGMHNHDVRKLQHALNAHLSSKHLKVDGDYGNATDVAVRRHQKEHNLGNDKPGESKVGSRQAKALGLTVAS